MKFANHAIFSEAKGEVAEPVSSIGFERARLEEDAEKPEIRIRSSLYRLRKGAGFAWRSALIS
jgi:hypothetical protein